VYLKHVQRPRLARRRGNPRDALPDEGIEQARFSDVGPAEEGNFGKRNSECDVGSREGADEGGIGQASFF
jgi:hypothetical protein